MTGAMFGPCVGGPYNGGRMTHHIEVFKVVTEKTLRLNKQQFLDSPANKGIPHGAYHFRDDKWRWHDGPCEIPKGALVCSKL